MSASLVEQNKVRLNPTAIRLPTRLSYVDFNATSEIPEQVLDVWDRGVMREGVGGMAYWNDGVKYALFDEISRDEATLFSALVDVGLHLRSGFTKTRKQQVTLGMNYANSFLHTSTYDQFRPITETEVESVINWGLNNGLLIEEGNSLPGASVSYGETDVYLSLTEACNMGCPQCALGSARYDDEFKIIPSRVMDWDLVAKSLRWTAEESARKSISQVHIKWAGGEPLLSGSAKRIWGSQELIDELKSEFGLTVRQTILTNGSMIDPDVVDKLISHDMAVSLSLWGATEREHNLMRQPVNKKAEFGKVIGGIRLLADSEVKFNVNYLISPKNILPDDEGGTGMHGMVRSMWDRDYPGYFFGGIDLREAVPLHVVFERAQTKEGQQLFVEGRNKIVYGIQQSLLEIQKLIDSGLVIPSVVSMFDKTSSQFNPRTCGAGMTYYAIDSRGNVAPCHEWLGTEKTINMHEATMESVNKLFLDSYPNEGLMARYNDHPGDCMIRGEDRTELRDYFGGRNSSLEAGWLGLLFGGGCPHQSASVYGDYRHVSPSYYVLEKVIRDLMTLDMMRLKNVNRNQL